MGAGAEGGWGVRDGAEERERWRDRTDGESRKLSLIHI